MTDNLIIQNQLDEVEETTGSGTSMVSLYIPADKDLTSMQTRMSQEKSESDNIKDDQNKKNVKKAIDKVNRILKRYKKTPENGLVIFAGVDDNGDIIEYTFDDFEEPIEYSSYKCDNRFDVDPLRERLVPDEKIGLIVIERGGVAIGELRGANITVHFDKESNVMGKHNAGGQSAVRFDRLIEEQKDNFFKKIRSKLTSLFIDENNQPTIDGIVLGGTDITVDNFVSDGYLPEPLKQIRIGGTYGVDVSNAEGLERLANLAEGEIQEVADQEARAATQRLFKALHSNSDTSATYGKDMVEKALEYGAVKKLLISSEIGNDVIREYDKKVQNQGGELFVVSTDFEQGEQLYQAFGGFAALLRYDIE